MVVVVSDTGKQQSRIKMPRSRQITKPDRGAEKGFEEDKQPVMIQNNNNSGVRRQ